MYPDFNEDDMREALESGYVTIFSSYPIKEGVFVTPSKMNALDYAGGKNGKVFSKKVPLNDVAWIDESEGQYAPANKMAQGGQVESDVFVILKSPTEMLDEINFNAQFKPEL
jgi:hypothetical protein